MPLSAFFMLVVDLGAALACLYALGYTQGRNRTPPRAALRAGLPGRYELGPAGRRRVHLPARLGVHVADLLGAGPARPRGPRPREAAYLYLVMASLGTAALLLCLGLLAGPGGAYDFASIRARAPELIPQALVLALAVFGAGSKAGLVPLHVWLPPAHAAAPSHVSALMSGVMTKVAVYAAMRPVRPCRASGLVVGGGAHVGGCGIRRHGPALRAAPVRSEAAARLQHGREPRHRLHRARASPWPSASGLPAAAAIALSAALLHALNHTLFKSLLFMGAGAVLHATHERDMDRLGGLIHRLPVTSACFLVGAAAISALPPLNGFVSEWLLFQAVLVSPQLPEGFLRFLAPADGRLDGLGRGIGCGLLRARLRHHLSRPSAQRGRAGARTRWTALTQAGMVSPLPPAC